MQEIRKSNLILYTYSMQNAQNNLDISITQKEILYECLFVKFFM